MRLTFPSFLFTDNLTMIKSAECDVEAVKRLVQSHVSSSQLLSNVGSEIAFQLPLGATSAFPDMLHDIEQEKKHVGIDDYGLSVTTMEEVFLRVRAAALSCKWKHVTNSHCALVSPRWRRAGTSKRLR